MHQIHDQIGGHHHISAGRSVGRMPQAQGRSDTPRVVAIKWKLLTYIGHGFGPVVDQEGMKFDVGQ